MIKYLGNLEVPQYLIDIIEARQSGEHNCFVAGTTIPPQLKELIEDYGYEIREPTDQVLLFSSQCGVHMHSDEQSSIIWVLCGTNCADMANSGNRSHQLICGEAYETLQDSGVYFVNTEEMHAVVANNHELWSVISLYVSKEA